MSKKLIASKTHKGLRPMTQRAIERAALADPDARPLTRNDLKRMPRTPQTKVIRRALGITQEEFSARYHIPLGTLRDWEQGRTTPDQPTQAYLTVIARSPESVQQALEA
jgi:putative transcriptional regulator